MNGSGGKKFLIVKTSAIGDILQTLPALERLHALFPGATVDWVVEKGGGALLLERHPGVRRVVLVDTKRWRYRPLSRETWQGCRESFRALVSERYDAVFDVQGNAKSGLITLLADAQEKVGFARDCVPEWPNLFATNLRFSLPRRGDVRSFYLSLIQKYAEERHGKAFPTGEKAEVVLELDPEEQARLTLLRMWMQGTARPCVMVAFGSKWPHKQLPFETLLSWLKEIKKRADVTFLFIFADEEEKKRAEHLQALFQETSRAVGDLSLPLWQALIASVDAVIAMDSAALHLAATTDTPSFSVFGPSNPSFYKPPGEKHCAFQGTCPYGQVFDKRCPRLRTCVTGACTKAILPSTLTEAFMAWWRPFS